RFGNSRDPFTIGDNTQCDFRCSDAADYSSTTSRQETTSKETEEFDTQDFKCQNAHQAS
ncbi:MAG: hypothetical protein SGILL_006477, partial [Bacillariaceae sp.]